MIENKFYKITTYDGGVYYVQFSHLQRKRNMIKNLYFREDKEEIVGCYRVEGHYFITEGLKIELL